MAKFNFDKWLMIWLLEKDIFIFEWDSGNKTKSYQKHNISCEEAESVFKRPELIRTLGVQVSPETSEKRFGLFGRTENEKDIFVSFTIRNEKIRIISVRELNKKEKALYEKLCEK